MMIADQWSWIAKRAIGAVSASNDRMLEADDR
jgi:hypothetical protein